MSFERFSSSDVYIYEHVGGFIECCGSWLGDTNFGLSIEDDEDSWFVRLNTPREALAHLDKHEAVGHDIGGARNRIIKEYPNLDVQIEPYKKTPEQEAMYQEWLESIKARFNEFPPQGFRDKSNGE